MAEFPSIDRPLICRRIWDLSGRPVGKQPFLLQAEAHSVGARNLRKVAGVPPGRPAQIALRCEAGVERSRQADREDGKERFDLDSPDGRLAALEALGVIRYNEELAKTTRREMVVAMRS
jgi:hypothetical protein